MTRRTVATQPAHCPGCACDPQDHGPCTSSDDPAGLTPWSAGEPRPEPLVQHCFGCGAPADYLARGLPEQWEPPRWCPGMQRPAR